jgi:hypothetical protein
MALFNNAMTVIRQLDTIIKDAACVEDVDRHVRVLDELYDTIEDMADEAHFRILLRRITSIKKTADVIRIQLEEEKAEEEDAEWEKKQESETRCLYIAAHIAFMYLSVLVAAAYIHYT